MTKKLLFLLLFTSFTYAQNPLLYQYNWQLSHIVYNGVTYTTPANPEVPSVFLQFTQLDNSFYTDVCNYLIGNIAATGTNTLAISNIMQSLILCNTQINGDFEVQYFNVLYQNGAGTLTYYFDTSDGEPTLTLTNGFNNSAVYNGVSLSKKEFNEDLIDLYPNPSEDVLHISSKNNLLENWNLEIYNQFGALLQSGKFGTSPSINVQHLPSGLYILKSSCRNQQLVKKFIKK